MSERSIPERTVDTWVAAAICSVFPDARIWDPSQAMKGRNWDRAFRSSEAGIIFIFEDKGTTAVTRTRKPPLKTHRIDIRADQLEWYCEVVEPASMIPVQAACRVISDVGPFPEWPTSAVVPTCAKNSAADAAWTPTICRCLAA